jgi:hypothetical protein
LADEKLAGRACRSVHLQFPGPRGVAFYNEVTIDESAPGTYFCVCGFNHGYFGLQELGNGKKLALFSVWDPGKQDDPRAVAEEQRVKLLHRDEKVRVGRFGGEGTGGQSFYDVDWKPGETYRFLVRARVATPRTEFEGWFFHNEEKTWKHLVTFSTLTKGDLLSGYYSFVEDFKRDGASARLARRARFGHGWIKDQAGDWKPLTTARFTADNNPATNIDAGVAGDRYFLATGGKTMNVGVQLGKQLDCKPNERAPPGDLPSGPK